MLVSVITRLLAGAPRHVPRDSTGLWLLARPLKPLLTHCFFPQSHTRVCARAPIRNVMRNVIA